MKIKTILRASVMMMLAVACALGFLTLTPEAHAMTSPPPEPRPDLTVVKAIYTDPNVTVTIKNIGDAPAPPSVLAVLLLKKTDPDTGQPEAFQFAVPALSPGQMIEKTANIGNSPFTNNGALAVSVDYKKQIAESDERNNWKSVVVALLPDLVIKSVEIINGTARVYVFNKCKGSAGPAGLYVTVYKGTNNKSGFGGSFSADVPPLAGNTGVMLVVDPWKYGNSIKSFSGRYIRVEVDDTNELKEAVETNNWWETGAAPFPDPANSCDPK